MSVLLKERPGQHSQNMDYKVVQLCVYMDAQNVGIVSVIFVEACVFVFVIGLFVPLSPWAVPRLSLTRSQQWIVTTTKVLSDAARR